MRYCGNCGNEIPEGMAFCEKCGAAVEDQAQKKNRKTLLLAVLAGFLVVTVGTVCALFATGVLGEKGTRETAAVKDAQNAEQTVQKDTNTRQAAERAWEAYQAYLDEIGPAVQAFAEYQSAYEEYETQVEEDQEYYDEYAVSLYDDLEEPSWEDYDEYDFPIEMFLDEDADHYHICGKLFFLDSDDYPELFLISQEYSGSVASGYVVLLTYKDDQVIMLEDPLRNDLWTGIAWEQDVWDVYDIRCKEKKNLIYFTGAEGRISQFIISYVRDMVCQYDPEKNSIELTWFGQRTFGDWGDDNEFYTEKKYQLFDAGIITGNGEDAGESSDPELEGEEISEEEYMRQLEQQKGDEAEWVDIIPQVYAIDNEGVWFDFASRHESMLPQLLELSSENVD